MQKIYDKTLIYHKAHSIRIDVKHSAAKTVFYQAEYLICVPCRLPKQLEHRHTLRECRKTSIARIASTAHAQTYGRNSPLLPYRPYDEIDKGYVHNHIIFCAADNMEHNKYHDCKQSYHRIRKLSDELCSEHNLSVIIPGGERGKKYNEWQADKNRAAWKTQIRKDINAAIKSSSTYEEFLLLMRAKGYEIKGETFGEDALKFISFRPLGKDRFVRGSIKSLGKEYTKEPIKDLAEIIKYAEQYKANKAYHIAYKKSKNPDAYFRKHESQIILYGGAKRMLEQAGIPLKGTGTARPG